MDIKVGEYVRTSKGYIFKIRHNKMVQGLKFLDAQYGTITKHSFNLTDLIEVRDIIKELDTKFNCKEFVYIDDLEMLEAIKEDLKERCKLLSILTHEQYDQNCYRLEKVEEESEENV